MIDIFKSVNVNTETAKWAKFEKPDDSIQGTFIGKSANVDGYGNKQIIYKIVKDGETYNVGFRENKLDIHGDPTYYVPVTMKGALYGEIVGFKFIEKKKIKNRAGQVVEIKVYRVFRDPKIVDEEFLANAGGDFNRVPPTNEEVIKNIVMPKEITEDEYKAQEALEELEGISKFGAAEAKPLPEVKPKVATVEDKKLVIAKLAKEKLGVTDASLVKEKVMEATGIAFIPANYDKIISALNSIDN